MYTCTDGASVKVVMRKPTAAAATGRTPGAAPTSLAAGAKGGPKPGHASTTLLLSPGGSLAASLGGGGMLLASSVNAARVGGGAGGGMGGAGGGLARVQPTMDPNTVLSGVAVTKPSGAVGISTKASLQPRRPHAESSGTSAVHTPGSGQGDVYKLRHQGGAAAGLIHHAPAASAAPAAASAAAAAASRKPSTLGGAAGSPAVARQQQQAAVDAAVIAALDSRGGAAAASVRHVFAGPAAAASRVHGPRSQDVVADARAALGETRRSVGRTLEPQALATGRILPTKQSFNAGGSSGLAALMSELGGGATDVASNLGSGRAAPLQQHGGAGGGVSLSTRNPGTKLAPVAESSRRLAGDDPLAGSLGGSKGSLSLQPLLGGAAAYGQGDDRDRKRQGALEALRGIGGSKSSVPAMAHTSD